MPRNRKQARAGGDPSARKKAKKKQSGKHAWKMLDRAATVVAGMVAQRATSTLWRAATGRKPPVSSAHPELSKMEAVTWAVFVGAGVELSKVLIHRATADYWVKSTGNLPPGMTRLTPTSAPEETDSMPAKEMPAGSREENPTGRKKVRSRNRGR